MRITIPGPPNCKRLLRSLIQFYDDKMEAKDLMFEIGGFLSFFSLEKPKIVWRNKFPQKVLGLAYQHGSIHLIKPAKWTRTKEEWVDTVLHELGHYILWADCERKADVFVDLFKKKATPMRKASTKKGE